MRICDRICDRIFWQKVQIAYFSAYNGIFKIAYAENTPHMLKFAYVAQISAYAIAFFTEMHDFWIKFSKIFWGEGTVPSPDSIPYLSAPLFQISGSATASTFSDT